MLPVPDERSGLRATIDVSDPEIREAFVRVAWYDEATGRPRQFALTDARYVRAGEITTLEITLDPPPGAAAYRVRVLARLRSPDALSAARCGARGALRPTSLPVRDPGHAAPALMAGPKGRQEARLKVRRQCPAIALEEDRAGYPFRL